MSSTSTNELPISKIYKFRNSVVGADSAVFNTHINKSGYLDTINLVDMNTHIGIEVEVERIFREGRIGEFADDKNGIMHTIWNNVSDGSLRNHGREFVSMPVKGREIGYALQLLNKTLHNDKQCIGHEFTDRTSVHVHMNVRDLTINQLSNLVMLYALVEPLLFSIESTNRDKSIFCVPWNESDVISQLYNLMDTTTPDGARLVSLGNWYKYTGLNLKPVTAYGTVEFRHMKGTCDVGILTKWINIILSLKKYAVGVEFKVLKERLLNLNTTSEYNAIILDIFGKELYDNFQTHDLQSLLETTSSNIKEMFIPAEFGVGLFKIVEQVHKLVYVEKPIRYIQHLLDTGVYRKLSYEKISAGLLQRKKDYMSHQNGLKSDIKRLQVEALKTTTSAKSRMAYEEEIRKLLKRKAKGDEILDNLDNLLAEIKNNPYINKQQDNKVGKEPVKGLFDDLEPIFEGARRWRNAGVAIPVPPPQVVIDDNF